MKPLRPALLLFALPAVLIALLPAGRGALLYEHDAILRGEIWRLWTGHWVHFSASHLGWNLVVLLVAGTLLERERPGLLRRYTLGAAPLISAACLVVAPAMHTYGGLSGLATGVVTLLALVKIDGEPRARAWWFALLGLVATKIIADAGHAAPLFSGFGSAAVRSSAWAHALGAGAAVLLVALSRNLRLPSADAGEPLASRRPGSGAYKFSGPPS